MKNLVQRFILLCLFMALSGLAMAADIPYNTIYYTSEDGKIVNPTRTNRFGANIVSNTYANGQGIITFDGNVTSIGEWAFCDCTSLASIQIPNSVTSIDYYAFFNCTSLTSIHIPNSVTNIKYGVFMYCEKLNSVTCQVATPPSVIDYTFEIYGTLHVLPGSKSAYEDAEIWKKFTIVEDAEEPHSNIYYTSSDGNIITPNEMNAFGANIVSNTYTNGQGIITFGGDVTSIGDNAFEHCSNLTSIYIPNSVTSIGNYAFYECSSLTSITIPNLVTSIGSNAFSGCSGLTSIEIPNSVTSIGNYAFYDCSSLKSVNIPNSITKIEEKTFYRCSELSSITIPSSVKSIGNCAFENCYGLTSVNIPNSLNHIGDYAFRACNRLNSVTNLSRIPQDIPFSLFSNYYGTTLHVLPGSKEAYQNARLWNIFTIVEDAENPHNIIYYTSTDGNIVTPKRTDVFGANIIDNTYADGQGIITFNGDVTNIGEEAFDDCRSLASIQIPNSVKSIEYRAFHDCTSLTSIQIPNSVTFIGTQAFYGCTSLTLIHIPNSIKELGTWAFSRCYNITSITVDEGNKYYDSRNNCNAIIHTSTNELVAGFQNTIIPNSVTSIGIGSFANYTNLNSIEIPNSVTSIGVGAFSLSGLTSIQIPNSVTSIGAQAFKYCISLTSIQIPNSVTSIGPEAFVDCGLVESLLIPNSVTHVGKWITNCMIPFTCLATTPPNAGGVISWAGETLHVLPGCKEAYENAEYWNRFTIVEDAVDPSAPIVLADGTPYNEETTQCNKEITYTRTFNNTSWQALYIPFSMSYDDWKDDFDVAFINSVRQYDNDEDGIVDETIMDIMRIKSGSLIPNTPYLIKAKSTGEKTITMNNTTLYKAEENSIECSTMLAKYIFTGTYSTIPSSTMAANNYYAMGGGKLVMTDGTSDLKPFRWYLNIESRSPMYSISSGAKTITINVVGEEEATGISQMAFGEPASAIYDLNGRKMSQKKLKSGLYIKNGKKVIIK